MAVEMHHIKRFPSPGGTYDSLPQGLERRGTQYRQLNIAPDRLQPRHQRPGHHLVTDIPSPGRTRDHHQHPQPSSGYNQRLCRVVGRKTPRDPARSQRHRPIPVTHHLPRQGQQLRIGRPEHHFQPQVLGPPVGTPSRTVTEHRPEDPIAPPGQPRPDRRAPVLPHPERSQQVILQIPAQILKGILAQRPEQRLPRYLLRRLALWPPHHPSPAVTTEIHQQTLSHSPTPSPRPSPAVSILLPSKRKWQSRKVAPCRRHTYAKKSTSTASTALSAPSSLGLGCWQSRDLLAQHLRSGVLRRGRRGRQRHPRG